MTTHKTYLEQVRERAEKATPGPWKQEHYPARAADKLVMSVPECHVVAETFGPQLGQTEADADFIAHARQDIPELLARLEIAERALERIEEEPNRMGPVADAAVEEYGIEAWNIAHDALTAIRAQAPGKEGGR